LPACAPASVLPAGDECEALLVRRCVWVCRCCLRGATMRWRLILRKSKVFNYASHFEKCFIKQRHGLWAVCMEMGAVVVCKPEGANKEPINQTFIEKEMFHKVGQ
jgi:hypothetical protein